MSIPTVLDLARTIAAEALRPGDLAIDATVGNGHDTLLLAGRVGSSGRVYGFDIQEAAIAATRRRLGEWSIAQRVVLHLCGHERMREVLPDDICGRVRSVMFNLGYLPGAAEKSVITRPETTLAALDAARDLLAPGGVITTVVYPAHDGGQEEAEAVERWACSCPRDTFTVYAYAPLNALRPAPRLVAVEKTSNSRPSVGNPVGG